MGVDHTDDQDDQGEEHPWDQGVGHLGKEATGAPVIVFGMCAMPRKTL